MKKFIFILCIVFILAFVFTNFQNNNENIRVRVIANSNSYEDQNIKNDVVVMLKGIINADDSFEEVNRKIPKLRESVEEYCLKNDVNIKVEFKKTQFPAKYLNGEVIPAGIYQTLLLTIGEGKGNNYWSLLYPEFYGITFEEIDSENIEVRSFFYELLEK